MERYHPKHTNGTDDRHMASTTFTNELNMRSTTSTTFSYKTHQKTSQNMKNHSTDKRKNTRDKISQTTPHPILPPLSRTSHNKRNKNEKIDEKYDLTTLGVNTQTSKYNQLQLKESTAITNQQHPRKEEAKQDQHLEKRDDHLQLRRQTSKDKQ
eukprot:383153-Amphidinium_carterae.2